MKCVFKICLCIFSFFIVSSVNASPANDSFIDDNLYKCIIDAYNTNLTEKKDYSYNILPEELIQITNLDCSNYKGTIEDLSGLNKLVGLKSLNLSGNIFLGGSLSIDGDSGKLKSNIKLPSSLSLTDVSYQIENNKIIKIVNDVIYPLSGGSTYVTMTGYVTGNEIKEKYLVSVTGDKFKKSNNSKLASLYLSKGEFSFDSDVKAYSVVVDNSVDSVQINASLLDKKAKFVAGYGPREVDLKVGLNTLNVKVQAEDNSVSTYTISVTRSDGSDLNNRLINIELSVGEIDFDPDVYIYNFTVDSNVDIIDIKAVSESALADVKVSDTKLKVGSNKITITVTSESGSKQLYELIVTREDYDSTDNYLKNVTIKNYNIDFKRDTFNYELIIKGEKSLTITPICEKESATYEIVGNNALKDNSKIIIKVSDKEGSTREYSILVHKSSILDLSFLDNIEIKWIILSLEFVTIVILLLIIIFKNNNKPRKPKKVVNSVSNNHSNKYISNICNNCGTVNDLKSKTCYVCGNILK